MGGLGRLFSPSRTKAINPCSGLHVWRGSPPPLRRASVQAGSRDIHSHSLQIRCRVQEDLKGLAMVAVGCRGKASGSVWLADHSFMFTVVQLFLFPFPERTLHFNEDLACILSAHYGSSVGVSTANTSWSKWSSALQNLKLNKSWSFSGAQKGKGVGGEHVFNFKEVIWLHWRLVEKQPQKL